MRLLLAAPALRLQLACSGPLYPSRRSLCPRSHAWPRVTGRWQRVYEHLRSAIVVCLVLRSLRFTACCVFSGCISLGVKQVAERLGITSGGLLNLKLPEPDAMIGRTRGWLPETIDRWNAKRRGRGVGGGRPRKKKTSDWHTRLALNQRPAVLETAALRLVRIKRYMRRSARRSNRNRLCINTNNRSRGSLEVVRIFRLSRSSRACRPHLGRAAGLESSRHRVSAGEAAMRLRRLLSRIGMTHFARNAPAGYGADAESPASPRYARAARRQTERRRCGCRRCRQHQREHACNPCQRYP